ncbi:MAG: 2-C-methyl-D-erythritol 2,4-cyclodiphosphate synthase [Clostridiales bacterium]|nr:2-C-methyl-D-erythritol 2,4-cyclodiphosphate synthase [Clostridiales bacterium]
MENRIGTGFDVHAFEEGRRLVLGGVEIPYNRGLKGHSDADVLIHALMDALLGAAGLGDIGEHFPDSDPAYKGISSMVLLEKVKELLDESLYMVANADITLIAQKPKIGPYKEQMRDNIARVLGVDRDRINVKGTTTEGLGFTGREEGIACEAVASIYR